MSNKDQIADGAGIKIYASVKNGINKELQRLDPSPELYQIDSFYNAKLLPKAIRSVSVKTMDQEAILKKLKTHKKLLEGYYTSQLQNHLTEQVRIAIPEPEKMAELAKHFTEVEQPIGKDDKGNSVIFKGYRVDREAFSQTVKDLNLATYTTYDITTKDEQSGGASLLGYANQVKALVELADKNGIKPDGGVVLRVGGEANGVDVYQVHLQIDHILTDILAEILKISPIYNAKKIEASRKQTPNIIDPEGHSFLGRPTNTSFIDMVAGAVEGREMAKLKEQYIDHKGRKDDGGFLAHIDNPQESLPFIFDDNDRPTLIKFIANAVAMAGDAIDALQAYRRDNPDYTGHVKITDIAKYIDQYANDMARGKGLRPEYRQRILNGLTLAGLMSTNYIIGHDRKRKTTEVKKVYVVNRIEGYEYNDKGTVITIKNPDFTDEYKANLANGLNLGVLTDGIRNLGDTETKVLARYIADRQVAKQNDTVEGKPIVCRADTLCNMASITDQHVTNRYRTLAKMLDTLEAKQTVVGRWVSKAGGKTITGYNAESQTLYLYPTNNVQKSYATKKHTKAVREANKLEQKARVKALKQYARGYTDFDVLAKEMGVKRTDLDLLLDGKLPITDPLLERIDTDLVK